MAAISTVRLQCFRLDGIRDTGIDIGRGSYAVVRELDFRGLKCVGKEIHSLLYEEATPRERAEMLQRFEEECELLGRLRHPNIVQFLGIHVASTGLPLLVMEYLPTTLSGCLGEHGVLPAEISLGILRDVAFGLRYLHEHSPPVIHRDLSANNVLLTTSLSAKISDLGVAKTLDMSPSHAARMTQTQVPGTPSYMPPETMVARPKYTSKVDIFSMGVMVVHILSGEWPIPSEGYAEDPLDPDNLIVVTEFDRRRGTIKKIESGHPLLGLIQQCLNNVPSRRPDAVDVACQLRDVSSLFPPSAESRLEQFQLVQSLRAELQLCSRENEALRREIEAAERSQTSYVTPENDFLQCQKDSEISLLRAEIERIRSELASVLGRTGAETEPNIHVESVQQRVNPPQAGGCQSPKRLSPLTRLEWRRGADAPARWGIRGIQALVMGERVCIGGWLDGNTVYQYFWERDTWSILPHCPVRSFGMHGPVFRQTDHCWWQGHARLSYW